MSLGAMLLTLVGSALLLGVTLGYGLGRFGAPRRPRTLLGPGDAMAARSRRPSR